MEKEKKKNPIKDEDLDQVTGGVGYDDDTDHPNYDVNNDIPEPDPFALIPPTVDDDGYISF